ncbi:MAG: hypothetical protein WC343_12765 [Bacilli bacterium]|jgi:hypothetical protein
MWLLTIYEAIKNRWHKKFIYRVNASIKSLTKDRRILQNAINSNDYNGERELNELSLAIYKLDRKIKALTVLKEVEADDYDNFFIR